jgi:hypothetical protein
MRKRVTIAVLAAALLVAGAALADRRADAERGHEHVDSRHGHNRSYLDRGVVMRSVPREAVVVPFGHDRYWFHGGIWYRPYGGRFIVIAPPIGIFVPVLPPFYTTVLIGGIPYYYANDAYYVYRDQRGYEVVEPPPGVDAMPGAAPPSGGAGTAPRRRQHLRVPEERAICRSAGERPLRVPPLGRGPDRLRSDPWRRRGCARTGRGEARGLLPGDERVPRGARLHGALRDTDR